LNQKSDRKLPIRRAAGPAEFLTHELTAARFKKEQFSFAHHGLILFRMLEQMPNGLANRGAAGLPKTAAATPIFPAGPRAVSPASFFRSPQRLRT
jgi:hypothetical protein